MTSGTSEVSSQSIAVATISSALLSLMIGFPVGFLVCKWLASRQNKTKASTNAQLHAANMNESQRLTNVNVCANNKNPLKNNLNTETLEKTVKKIYL